MKTMFAILALGLVSCAAEDETVEEPITAEDIHAIESDTEPNETSWTMTEDETVIEDASLADTSENDTQSTEEAAENPDIMGDFASGIDNTKGDWTSAPSDAESSLEPAAFMETEPTNESSDSFITAMTDVEEIESSFQPDAAGQYIVRPGDSLSGIAAKIYGSTARWRELASLNSIGGKYVIHPGDTVRFEVDTDQARTYAERFEALPRAVVTVKKGDTLSKIATRIYGKANYWKVLMTLNQDKIASPDKIFVGTRLQYVKPDALDSLATSGTSTTRAIAQANE